MTTPSREPVYVLHPVGYADLGVLPGAHNGANAILARLKSENDPAPILRLELPEQDAGMVAPLQAILELPDTDGVALADANQVMLLLIATEQVAHIADGIVSALRKAPQAYGRAFDDIDIVQSESLEEIAIAAAVRERLSAATGRVFVTWGSGATQAALGALDAVIELGLSWAFAWVNPKRDARSQTYDFTVNLPIDPVVPLLRRWRYHDLLASLVQQGVIKVDDALRNALESEAGRWGRAYTEPTADRLRSLMAAALMRGDGSSGFAVRAYIKMRYRELWSGELDLLTWASRAKGEGATLGVLLRHIKRDDSDPTVRAAKQTPAGRWITSPVVEALNKLGAASSHELAPPEPEMLAKLGEHLAEFGADHDEASTLDPVPLIPAQRIWYVTVLGLDRGELQPIEQIAEAATDPARFGRLDEPARAYLGVPDGRPASIAILMLSTEATHDNARELAKRLGLHAHADQLDEDADDSGAEVLLRKHIGPDAGAIVVVPSGPKEHVLPLLMAAQRLAAVRGIPLFLRQIVDKNRDVVEAKAHRLPLRFGIDLALISAALHALDIAELDTACRLLGAMGSYPALADRARVISRLLRDANDGGLMRQRLEVWANLPGLQSDTTTQMRAIIGACVAIESSLKARLGRRQKKADRDHDVPFAAPLFKVRNRLPITHPRESGPESLDVLVREHTQNTHRSAAELLAAMVRACPHGEVHNGRAIADLWRELREDLRQLRDAEVARLNGVRAHAS